MDLAVLSSRLARRWWLVAGLAAVAAIGAVTAGAAGSDERRTKLEFVLRPDASVTNDDLPGTLEALKSDGTLVQTMIGVLGNRTMLRRAAAYSDVRLTSGYTVDASARPGSTLIDSTLSGPDRSALDRLVAGYAREASIYVSSSYPAYVLEHLTTQAVTSESGPGTGQVVIAALLVGGALGVLLVAAELRLEPQFRRHAAERRESSGPPGAEPRPEAEAAPAPDVEPVTSPPEPSWSRETNGGPRSDGAPKSAQPSHSSPPPSDGPQPGRAGPGPIR
jgi:hypothetical protein